MSEEYTIEELFEQAKELYAEVERVEQVMVDRLRTILEIPVEHEAVTRDISLEHITTNPATFDEMIQKMSRLKTEILKKDLKEKLK